MSEQQNIDPHQLRKEYASGSLHRSQLSDSPFMQFHAWLREAVSHDVIEPNAMSLATVSPEGHPSVRTVLMKSIDDHSLTFYTNYKSRKANELTATPHAAVCFYWRELERQVQIEGSIEKTSREESATYFARRPRRSQLGAWASHQDAPLSSREELEKAFANYEDKFRDQPVPLPDFWGGFRLIPNKFEFWQGRLNRIHDRFVYVLVDNQWTIQRLSP